MTPPRTPARPHARRRPDRRSRLTRRLLAVPVTTALVGAVAAVATAPATAATAGTTTTSSATATLLPARSAVTWGTNGRVHTVVPVGDRVLVAGDFSALVSPAGETVPAGNLALFDPVSGTFDRGFAARTDGAVTAVATDGTTVYLGGDFTGVNGVARSHLAAVTLATGATTAWAPRADNSVRALTLVGGSVFVAGTFTKVTDVRGAVSTPYLARLGPDGALSGVHVPVSDGPVFAMLPTPDGETLYLGGDFLTMDGLSGPARRTARTSVATGQLDPAFRSGPTNDANRSPVAAMTLGSAGLVVAVGGGGGGCATLDPATGATRWAKKANGDMQSVVEVDGIVYCGGHFGGSNGFTGVKRDKIAAVDPATGALLDYAPVVNSALGIWTMATDGRRLFVGGDFDKFGTSAGLGHLATLLPASLQSVPAPVAHLGGEAYDRSVELAWEAPSTDGGQAVRYYTVTRSLGTRKTVLASRLKDTVFVDDTVANGTGYTYAVTVSNALGAGPVSSTPVLTPATVQAVAPDAPRDAIALAGEQAADVSWQAPAASGGAPVTAYRLYRGTGGATPTLLTTLGSTERAWHDTAVVAGTSYRYEVAAVNAAGEGARAATGSVVPAAARPPTPVLSVTRGPGSGEVTLTWTTPPNTSGSPVTKYIVLRDRVRLVSRQATSPGGGGYVDTGLVPGRSYLYQVKSVSAAGTSLASKAVSVTAP